MIALAVRPCAQWMRSRLGRARWATLRTASGVVCGARATSRASTAQSMARSYHRFADSPTSRRGARPKFCACSPGAPEDTMADTRTEKDALGELAVPAGAYHGVQTQRAVENFPI